MFYFLKEENLEYDFTWFHHGDCPHIEYIKQIEDHNRRKDLGEEKKQKSLFSCRTTENVLKSFAYGRKLAF